MGLGYFYATDLSIAGANIRQFFEFAKPFEKIFGNIF